MSADGWIVTDDGRCVIDGGEGNQRSRRPGILQNEATFNVLQNTLLQVKTAHGRVIWVTHSSTILVHQ